VSVLPPSESFRARARRDRDTDGRTDTRPMIDVYRDNTQWRNDGVAAASSDGGPTGGRAPDSSRVLSD